MQSSKSTAGRALVMLGFSLAFPLVAMFGTSLLEKAKNVLEGQLFGEARPAREQLSEAPPFRPAQIAGKPDSQPNQAASNHSVRGSFENPAQKGATSEPQRLAESASQGDLSRGRGGDNTSPLASVPASALGSWQREEGGVIQVGYEARESEGSRARTQQATHVQEPLAASSQLPEMPAASVDQFRHAQERLQQLGATYYRLETWGTGGQRFRFQCRVPCRTNPTCERHFEATDSDALQAMGRVVSDVQQWLGGQ